MEGASIPLLSAASSCVASPNASPVQQSAPSPTLPAATRSPPSCAQRVSASAASLQRCRAKQQTPRNQNCNPLFAHRASASAASLRSLSAKAAWSRRSLTRRPLRVALDAYAGPMPRLVVPIFLPGGAWVYMCVRVWGELVREQHCVSRRRLLTRASARLPIQAPRAAPANHSHGTREQSPPQPYTPSHHTHAQAGTPTGELRLARAVDLLVQVKQQVGAVRHQQPPVQLHALGAQLPHLLKQPGHVHHHAVADHVGGAPVWGSGSFGGGGPAGKVVVVGAGGRSSACSRPRFGGNQLALLCRGIGVRGMPPARAEPFASRHLAFCHRIPNSLLTC